LHPSAVTKSSTSFNWRGKGKNVTFVVTLCDPIWHNTRSDKANCKLLYLTSLYFTLFQSDNSHPEEQHGVIDSIATPQPEHLCTIPDQLAIMQVILL